MRAVEENGRAQRRVPLIGIETPPMEASAADELPQGPGWQYEPKWDGFRCLAFKDGGKVDLRAKSGKPLARYFPEVVDLLQGLPAKRFVIDGELTIALDGSLSFDALQMRLHPAESRIRKLAAETPATLIVFDMLVDPEGRDLGAKPLSERRAALERFVSGAATDDIVLSPATRDRDEALRWLEGSGGPTDGVVAKRHDGPYLAGERAMVKVKRLRTADCVVGGFRYASKSRLVGSLLLGLYDEEGRLDHVGFTSTLSAAERPALTARLEALTGPPGFTGRAPGGPSRWSTERSGEWEPLRHELVVEVRYDHVTGDRFRHGTKLLRWRPDKAPRQCKLEQIRSSMKLGELP
jgi:ATP-dependent DNA ligase